MNDIDARAVPAPGGYYGEFRQIHRAKWFRVRNAQGADQLFDSADRAEVMAWRQLKDHMFSLVRSQRGESGRRGHAAAERLFKQPGGGQ